MRMSLSMQVHLAKFEGPLGLLLHLIKKEEMDIFDININEITKQYLDFVKAMRELDLESAGDFVAMAATLLQIKSRMLLPDYQKDLEESDEGRDPRKELVKKLIEYQKYKGAASWLQKQPRLFRDFWRRSAKESYEGSVREEILIEENPLFTLISSYRLVVRNMRSGIHTVAAALQSIASRILELGEKLKMGQRNLFSELITATQDRSGQTLITFLSILELGRLGFVSFFQSEVLGEIHIFLKKPIEKDVVDRVEDFENALNSKNVVGPIDGPSMVSSEEGEAQSDVSLEIPNEAQTTFNMQKFEPAPWEEEASDAEILAAEQELGFANSSQGESDEQVSEEGDRAQVAKPVTEAVKREGNKNEFES